MYQMANLLFFFILAFCSHATRFYKPLPKEVISGFAAEPWETIEKHRDYHPRFPSTPFHPKLSQLYPQTREAFGSETPPDRDFLLYLAKDWNQSKGVPVLLVHGANDDATRRWAYPTSRFSENHTKIPGLMQYLSERGIPVFGISFSHYHGDNLYQGEQIANAISRIRKLLNRESDHSFKVDLISYSKGAMAVRSYLQSASEYYHKKFLTPYRGDVRRVCFIGGPIGGLDLPFRYYLYNLNIQVRDLPAPMGATKLRAGMLMKKTGINHIQSGYWPGQLQMIHDQRLLGVPHGPLSLTLDANQTGRALVDGGNSTFLEGGGLEAARKAGGRMIEVLNSKGLPSDIEAILIGGTLPVLFDEVHPNWPFPEGAQIIAPNDGLVFLKSALHVDGLKAQGAKILDTKAFALNHLGLSRNAEVFDYIFQKLIH